MHIVGDDFFKSLMKKDSLNSIVFQTDFQAAASGFVIQTRHSAMFWNSGVSVTSSFPKK